MTVNEKIRKSIKEAKGVSNSAIAKILGISRQAFGELINKDKEIDSIRIIKAVCQATGKSFDYFVDVPSSQAYNILEVRDREADYAKKDEDKSAAEFWRKEYENQKLANAELIIRIHERDIRLEKLEDLLDQRDNDRL